jgi:hypothetical protein
MRRRIAVMVAMVMMVLMMSAAPALAHHDIGHTNNGTKVNDGADRDQGGGNDAPKKAKENQGGGND